MPIEQEETESVKTAPVSAPDKPESPRPRSEGVHPNGNYEPFDEPAAAK
ncbi:hypothetical protein GCM10022222_82530 [Amycolatopsis ultiminotia]|uniref:Uncharacterized protein n=1 Tax=Amycolatopsis ultiminotia TaxID=543629 RepID=A0ABP6YLZ0_9PSEU